MNCYKGYNVIPFNLRLFSKQFISNVQLVNQGFDLERNSHHPRIVVAIPLISKYKITVSICNQ